MAWLARLDSRAARWSRVWYWTYQFVKWNLVAMGAYAIGWIALIEMREHRVGLGTGVVTFVLWTYTPRLWHALARRRP